MSFLKNRTYYSKDYYLSFGDKLLRFNYLYLFFIFLVVGFGITVLYSVAGGHFSPWALKQTLRFFLSLSVLFAISFINMRFLMKYAYWIYGATLILLASVSLIGHIGMGAQRWLNLGFFVLQPSELMKISLI